MSMRHFCLSLLVLVLTLAGCTQSRRAEAQGPSQLRVLTYNIHIGIGTDDRLDLPRIAQVIRQCNPDVVAVQELDNRTTRTQSIDEPAELAKLTGMRVQFGKTIDLKGGQYGIGILSRWPISQPELHPLPQVGQREPRVALAATITPDNGIAPFLFICTHLDHAADEQNSLPQVRVIDDLFANRDTRAILAGDLNKSPNTQTIRQLCQSWTNATAGGDHFTIPATQPTHQIDYILYRPTTQWRVVEAKVIGEPMASDHRPVLVVLEPIRQSR
ncbi:MAG: endonuclease/exonuclease/phosphatase family protein [Bacillota bacterium]